MYPVTDGCLPPAAEAAPVGRGRAVARTQRPQPIVWDRQSGQQQQQQEPQRQQQRPPTAVRGLRTLQRARRSRGPRHRGGTR